MTKLLHKDKPIIGLDISQTGIKVMSIDPKKWLVLGYGSLDLDPARVQIFFSKIPMIPIYPKTLQIF